MLTDRLDGLAAGTRAAVLIGAMLWAAFFAAVALAITAWLLEAPTPSAGAVLADAYWYCRRPPC